MDTIANALKTLGHPERLRILALLSHGELTVSELTQILALSQPRVTQYIKSLEAAGIIERLKEGSWVFSRLRRGNAQVTALVATVLASLPEDDNTLASDRRRLSDVRASRAREAEDFFASVANDHGQLGDEYLPQSDIEAALLKAAGEGPFDFMVDLGTGTGRMLSVFAARTARGSGIDNNTDMLKVARHNLASAGHDHISVRQGDLHATPLESASADLITLHQVLHYLDDPRAAIAEAARLLAPSGRLLIVDFDTHAIERYREDFAHRRLGFSDVDMSGWAADLGLSLHSPVTIKTGDTTRPQVKIWTLQKSATAIGASHAR